MKNDIVVDTNFLNQCVNNNKQVNQDINKAVSEFQGSYLCTCGDAIISRIGPKLSPLYQSLKSVSNNAASYITKYATDAKNLEEVLSGDMSSGMLNDPTSRTQVNSMPKLKKYRMNEPHYNSINRENRSYINKTTVNQDNTKYNINKNKSNKPSIGGFIKYLWEDAGYGDKVYSFCESVTNLEKNVGKKIMSFAEKANETKAAVEKEAVSIYAKAKSTAKKLSTKEGREEALDSLSQEIEEIKKEATTNVKTIKDKMSTKEGRQEILTEAVKATVNVINTVHTTKQRVKATGATVFTGIAKGVIKTGEDLRDGLEMLGGAIVNGGIAVVDLAAYAIGKTDANNLRTDKFMKKLSDHVKEDYASEMIEDIETNTGYSKIANYEKENAYGYETVIGFSEGIGNVAGTMALSAVGAGVVSKFTKATTVATALDSGVKATKAFTQASTAISFVSGTGRGSQEAYQNGASATSGLIYGLGSGAWEGLQWYTGSKIANYNLTESKIGKKVISKSITSGKKQLINSGARIVLDSVDGAAEGFVQPGLKKIYDKRTYKELYEESGGLQNVIMQGAIGGVMSAGGEVKDIRKAFSKNKNLKVEPLFDKTQVTSNNIKNENSLFEKSKKILDKLSIKNCYSNNEIIDKCEESIEDKISKSFKNKFDALKTLKGLVACGPETLFKAVNIKVSNNTDMAEKISKNGILHFTSDEAAKKIMDSGYIKASGGITSYGSKKSYFFAGVPSFEQMAINVSDDLHPKICAVRVKPTLDDIDNLSYRALTDEAVSYKGNYKLKDNAEIAYFGLKEDNGKLLYKEISKAEYDNYELKISKNIVQTKINQLKYKMIGIAEEYDYLLNGIDKLKNRAKNSRDPKMITLLSPQEKNKFQLDVNKKLSKNSFDFTSLNGVNSKLINLPQKRVIDGMLFCSDSEQGLKLLENYYEGLKKSSNDNLFARKKLQVLTENNLTITNVDFSNLKISYQHLSAICLSNETLLNNNYETFFHETGHYSDFLASNYEVGLKNISELNEKFINDHAIKKKMFIQDFEKNRSDIYKYVNNNEVEYLRKKAKLECDNIFKYGDYTDLAKENIYNEIYQNFYDERINHYIKKSGYGSVSDIIDALTKGEMHDDHYLLGHGKSYFSEASSVSTEIIADYSALYSRNKEELLYKYLPKEYCDELAKCHAKIVGLDSITSEEANKELKNLTENISQLRNAQSELTQSIGSIQGELSYIEQQVAQSRNNIDNCLIATAQKYNYSKEQLEVIRKRFYAGEANVITSKNDYRNFALQELSNINAMSQSYYQKNNILNSYSENLKAINLQLDKSERYSNQLLKFFGLNNMSIQLEKAKISDNLNPQNIFELNSKKNGVLSKVKSVISKPFDPLIQKDVNKHLIEIVNSVNAKGYDGVEALYNLYKTGDIGVIDSKYISYFQTLDPEYICKFLVSDELNGAKIGANKKSDLSIFNKNTTDKMSFKNYKNKDEIVKSIKNPIDDLTVMETLFDKFMKKGDAYSKLINEDAAKILPSRSTVENFENFFEMNIDKEIKKHPVFSQGDFLHVYGKGGTSKINSRLYLNFDSYDDAYNFIMKFTQEADKQNVPFYLKTPRILTEDLVNSNDLSRVNRAETVVIYTNDNNIANHVGLINDVMKNNKSFKVSNPPVASGKINGYIGFGQECQGGRRSYNDIRSDVIETSFKKVLSSMTDSDLQKISNDKKAFNKFLKDVSNEMKVYGKQEYDINENNFCVYNYDNVFESEYGY